MAIGSSFNPDFANALAVIAGTFSFGQSGQPQPCSQQPTPQLQSAAPPLMLAGNRSGELKKASFIVRIYGRRGLSIMGAYIQVVLILCGCLLFDTTCYAKVTTLHGFSPYGGGGGF